MKNMHSYISLLLIVLYKKFINMMLKVVKANKFIEKMNIYMVESSKF